MLPPMPGFVSQALGSKVNSVERTRLDCSARAGPAVLAVPWRGRCDLGGGRWPGAGTHAGPWPLLSAWVQGLRARHDAQGLRLQARTACPDWLGARLDLGWAIDVLHPLATREVGSTPDPPRSDEPDPSVDEPRGRADPRNLTGRSTKQQLYSAADPEGRAIQTLALGRKAPRSRSARPATSRSRSHHSPTWVRAALRAGRRW